MSNQAKDWQEGEYTIRVKQGEVEVSTIRTVTKTYLSCATDIHKRYVATARCAPEDEFSLSMGVALAMDRLNKELGKGKIEIGDKVKIKNAGSFYPTHIDWIKKNIDDVGLAACFAYDKTPKTVNTIYIVKAMAPWCDEYGLDKDEMLAYVQRYFKFSNGRISNNEPCYLMRVDGLEKIYE